jgi:photosynthetic reaction center cytochrome c subunit
MSRVAQISKWLTAAVAVTLLAGCERPPVTAIQNGYRGTGMEQVNNPRTDAITVALNQAPQTPEPASPDGPKAGQVYQNVKLLGNLSVAEFTRHMNSITQWVSPKEGCNYCHNPANLADDSKYTKVVARRMLQMTQHLNKDWQPHVGATGVTCYTCHRGNPVPAAVWYAPMDRKYAANSIMGDLAGQNLASTSVGLSSLPFDPYTPYLKEDKPIRVIGDHALKMTGAAANLKTTKQAEHTYGAHEQFAGCELHLLPQHAQLPRLERRAAAAHHRLARHPHGARLERGLPGTADLNLPCQPPGSER